VLTLADHWTPSCVNNFIEQTPFEKLIVAQLLNTFPTFYRNRRFITVFIGPGRLSLSCVTNCIEQSLSLKANSTSATEETLPWNRKVPCCIHKSLSLVHILSQINALCTFTTSFFVLHFNIILPPMPRSSKRSISFRFLCQNLCWLSFSLPHLLHVLPI
jgi:hypothetical protein